MDYFRNDEQAVTASGFSIENGVGSVLVHGSVTLVADEASLVAVRALSARLAEIEKALLVAIEEGFPVPGDVVVDLETVDNPFA